MASLGEATLNRNAMRYWGTAGYEELTRFASPRVPAHWQEVYQLLFRSLAVKRIRAWIGEDRVRRVVDLGCGPGDWTAAYLDFAGRVTGVDISTDLLALARQKAAGTGRGESASFVRADMLDYDDYTEADLVCLGACVQYLSGDQLGTLLEKLTKCLTPGTRIYLRTTVASPLRGTHRSDIGFYRTRRDYERMFGNARLRVEDAFYTESVFPEAAFRDLIGMPSTLAASLAAPLWGCVVGLRALLRSSNYLSWFLRCAPAVLSSAAPCETCSQQQNR